jgi:hypothetical protein
MNRLRHVACVVLVVGLAAPSALAQQPIQDAARRAATVAASNADAQEQGSSRQSGRFFTGAALVAAGGTAIILGTTVLKTADTTSGNTPIGVYDACVAIKANPVYRGNACEVLKGPNRAAVIGGAVAVAAGAALMMLGSSNSNISVGPAGITLRHKMKF